MTATIAPPPGTPSLARSDPAVRLSDYIEALGFYLTVPDDAIDHILLVDNSETDLAPLQELVAASGTKKRVELMTFQGNDHPPAFGKGYGEFRLMDYGFSHSESMSNDKVVWKVTGRLRVLNLAQIARSAPSSFDVYCDLRDVPLIGHRLGANQWMELRLWASTRRSYERIFKGIYRELSRENCHQAPEQYLFTMLKARSDVDLVPRFTVQPKIEGFGGHKNADYRAGGYLAKEVLRTITRRIAPYIWL